jgi:2-dehydro-3-deoxy-D-gluconate 5-dehydrogenase
MMIDLSEQTVLIIGEIHELAMGVGHTMQQAGAKLIFASPSPIALPNAETLTVTLDDPAALIAQLAQLPALNTVVISPGWFAHQTFLDTSLEDIDAAFQHNFEYPIYIIQAVARHLLQQNTGGSIVVLSSVASLKPFIHTNLAGSSLAALEVVVKMAAVDLGSAGIRVNILAAGWVNSDWSHPLLNEAGKLHIPSDIPLNQAGTPEEVGAACCFLASPLSRYITGAILPVDGGYLLTKSEGKTPYPPA